MTRSSFEGIATRSADRAPRSTPVRADHGPWRLRRRRHLLDGDPGRRAAPGRRRVRLAHPRPARRRLRAQRRVARATSRSAARGLLITADCGIGSVAEVAAIARGRDRRRRHRPPPAGRASCPTARSSTRSSAAIRSRRSAARRSRKARLGALEREPAAGGEDADPRPRPRRARHVADLVPLVGENRSLARARPRRAPARARAPGLRALMEAATCRARADRRGRHRLPARPAAERRRAPLPRRRRRRADADRRPRPRRRRSPPSSTPPTTSGARPSGEVSNEAEAALRALPDELRSAPALVVAGEGWHPGVVGIVASRLVERHGRPAIVLSIDDDGPGEGVGAKRPGLRPARRARRLRRSPRSLRRPSRRGRARAAGGADRCLPRRLRRPRPHGRAVAPSRGRAELVDAFVGAESLDLDVAEQLATLAPFGQGNPGIKLLVPGARVGDVRPMGEEGKHARFSLSTGALSARGVAFNANGTLAAAQRVAARPHGAARGQPLERRGRAARRARRRLRQRPPRPTATAATVTVPLRRGTRSTLVGALRRRARRATRRPLPPRRRCRRREERQVLDARRGSAIGADRRAALQRRAGDGRRRRRRRRARWPARRARSVSGGRSPVCACLRCPAGELTRLAAAGDGTCCSPTGARSRPRRAPRPASSISSSSTLRASADTSAPRRGSGAGFPHRCWSAGVELAELCWDARVGSAGPLAEIYRGLGRGELRGEARSARSSSGAGPLSAARRRRRRAACGSSSELGLSSGGDEGDARWLRVVSSERTSWIDPAPCAPTRRPTRRA